MESTSSSHIMGNNFYDWRISLFINIIIIICNNTLVDAKSLTQSSATCDLYDTKEIYLRNTTTGLYYGLEQYTQFDRIKQIDKNEGWELFLEFDQVAGKFCPCEPDYMCIDGEECHAEWFGIFERVTCRDKYTELDTFAQGVFSIIWIWSLVLGILSIVLVRGRNALAYVLYKVIIPLLTCCMPDRYDFFRNLKKNLRKDRYIERMVKAQLRRERNIRNTNREIFLQRLGNHERLSWLSTNLLRGGTFQLSDVLSGNAQVQLVIKTRIFKSEIPGSDLENGDNSRFQDERNNVTCSICLCEIEDGDRIGDLQVCNHMFHIACIKGWLARKNTCPLCQQEDIAYPKIVSARSSS